MSLRRLEGLAAFSDFDPRRNPVPWKNCFLIYVDPCDGNARFELVGQRLLIGLNGMSSNLYPRTLPPSFLGEMTQGLDEVLASGCPLQREGIYHARVRLAILYRSILLPFADLRRHSAYLLGAATYRSAVVPPGTPTELRR